MMSIKDFKDFEKLLELVVLSNENSKRAVILIIGLEIVP